MLQTLARLLRHPVLLSRHPRRSSRRPRQVPVQRRRRWAWLQAKGCHWRQLQRRKHRPQRRLALPLRHPPQGPWCHPGQRWWAPAPQPPGFPVAARRQPHTPPRVRWPPPLAQVAPQSQLPPQRAHYAQLHPPKQGQEQAHLARSQAAQGELCHPRQCPHHPLQAPRVPQPAPHCRHWSRHYHRRRCWARAVCRAR